MSALFPPSLAVVSGFSWLNLVLVLGGIAAFLAVIAAFGRYLAATHPDPVATAPVEKDAMTGISPDTAAIIAAAVYATLGGTARVTAVIPRESVKVNVDSLMLQWSLEGRREIYSSHRVR